MGIDEIIDKIHKEKDDKFMAEFSANLSSEERILNVFARMDERFWNRFMKVLKAVFIYLMVFGVVLFALLGWMALIAIGAMP